MAAPIVDAVFRFLTEAAKGASKVFTWWTSPGGRGLSKQRSEGERLEEEANEALALYQANKTLENWKLYEEARDKLRRWAANN